LSSPSLNPASIIADRYRIDTRLGSGGMGEVFRAHDRVLKRSVALKVLREDEAGLQTGEEDTGKRKDPFRQLLREARLCAALQHPNIVTIFDVGVSEGIAFIAMELIEGNNLRVSAANPSATPDEKLMWLRDVASALEAAHAVGLVHRDIKPDNVIVKKDGSVKVLDFGIAKWTPGLRPLNATAGVTTGPVFAGTPGYMPPEQRLGQVDERSDQYGWGVLAFETLGGVRAPKDRPLSAADIHERIADPAIASTIERATSYRAEDRHPSMRALLDSLAASTTAARSTTRPPPKHASDTATKTWSPSDVRASKKPTVRSGKGKPPRSRAKVFFAAAAITAVLGIVGIVALVVRAKRQQPSSPPLTNTTTTTPSDSSSSSPPLINSLIDSGITMDEDQPSPLPPRKRTGGGAAVDAAAVPDPPSPQALVSRIAIKGGPERVMTIAGFGTGAFTNAQAHRLCERRAPSVRNCLADDTVTTNSIDYVRSIAEVGSTARVEMAAMGWEPRRVGGGRFLNCVGNVLDGRHLFEDAGLPARGFDAYRSADKHILGCQISITPKVATLPPITSGTLTFIPPPTTTTTTPTQPTQPTHPAGSSSFSWTRPSPPSNELTGTVRHAHIMSSAGVEYLEPSELNRWQAIVGPRVAPCFNLPRGDCNPSFVLVHFRGSVENVYRITGLKQPDERACSYSAELHACVKKAIASEPLKVKGDSGSQYQLSIQLSP